MPPEVQVAAVERPPAEPHLICSICLSCLFDTRDELLNTQNAVVWIECGHTFHDGCIDAAIEAKRPDDPDGIMERDCPLCPICNCMSTYCEDGNCDGDCAPTKRLFFSEDASNAIGPPYVGDFTINAAAVKQLDMAKLAKTIGVKVDKVHKKLEEMLQAKDDEGGWEEVEAPGPGSQSVKTLVPTIRDLASELQRDHGRDLNRAYIDKLQEAAENMLFLGNLTESMDELRDTLAESQSSARLAKETAKAEATKISKLQVQTIELEMKRLRSTTKKEVEDAEKVRLGLVETHRGEVKRLDEVAEKIRMDLKGREDDLKNKDVEIRNLKTSVRDAQKTIRRTERRNTKTDLELQKARHDLKETEAKLEAREKEIEEMRKKIEKYEEGSSVLQSQLLTAKCAEMLLKMSTAPPPTFPYSVSPGSGSGSGTTTHGTGNATNDAMTSEHDKRPTRTKTKIKFRPKLKAPNKDADTSDLTEIDEPDLTPRSRTKARTKTSNAVKAVKPDRREIRGISGSQAISLDGSDSETDDRQMDMLMRSDTGSRAEEGDGSDENWRSAEDRASGSGGEESEGDEDELGSELTGHEDQDEDEDGSSIVDSEDEVPSPFVKGGYRTPPSKMNKEQRRSVPPLGRRVASGLGSTPGTGTGSGSGAARAGNGRVGTFVRDENDGGASGSGSGTNDNHPNDVTHAQQKGTNTTNPRTRKLDSVDPSSSEGPSSNRKKPKLSGLAARRPIVALTPNSSSEMSVVDPNDPLGIFTDEDEDEVDRGTGGLGGKEKRTVGRAGVQQGGGDKENRRRVERGGA